MLHAQVMHKFGGDYYHGKAESTCRGLFKMPAAEPRMHCMHDFGGDGGARDALGKRRR